VREFRPHIVFFQDTRRKLDKTLSYNFINKTRGDEANLGGVIFIGVDK
jgi:hypothetical protein